MAEVLRVSIQGNMPGGEKWSVNPCFHLITEPTPDFTELNTIAGAINALLPGAALMGLMSTGTNISGCRVEARESNGDLVALAERPRGAVDAGTSGIGLPYQTSMVFSLRTNHVGASGRGRLYWPATGAAISAATLRPSSLVVSNALTAMETFLSGVQGAVEATLGDAPLSVWSRTTLGTFGVTKILAGDVLDVQRRRRDKLAEAYQEVAYVA